MWASAAQAYQPTQIIQANPLPFLNQDEDGSVGPQSTSREQQLLLQLEQARAEINIYDAKLRALEEAQAGAPVQERSRNDPESDASMDDGRAPPPQAVRGKPDIRMFLPDSQGMAAEHLSDNAGGSVARPASEDGMLVTSTTAHPTGEWSRLHVITASTTSVEERCEILFQTVKRLDESHKEKDQKLDQVRQMNNSLLTQLSAAKVGGEVAGRRVVQLEQENGSLKEKVRIQADMIRELQNQQNQSNQHLSVRAGVKRGRFITSVASLLECSKCSQVFLSRDAACNSICYHHLQAGCELPKKMMAEMSPEKGKLRYWPCCKQIGAKTPPPCHHGAHTLRAS